MGRLFYYFISGVKSQNPFILIIAAIVTVTSLVWLEVLVRQGSFTQIDEMHLLRDSKDLFTHISYQVGKLKRHSTSNNIYFMGGSSVAYAVKPGEFEKLIYEKTGKKVSVYNFAIGRQSLIESLALIDSLPNSSGTVVIGLNPRLLSRQNKLSYERWRQNRLLLYSERANEFLISQGKKEFATRYLFPNIVWRIKNQLWVHRKAFLSGELPRTQYDPQWYRRKMHPPKKKAKYIKGFVERSVKRFDKHIHLNLAALESIIALAVEKDLKLGFVDLPLNPRTLAKFGNEFLKKYYRTLQPYTSHPSVHYVAANIFNGFIDSDFVDGVHVLAHGRHKLQQKLVEEFERLPMLSPPPSKPMSVS